ncbi:hypothetical protein [Tunturiibacter lichenicola]|uniref:hypothetical protein n=1 Tax=Tunturiibacter lichenicola TaxID=2051959 RepID=UPI003D9BD676
MARNQFYGPGFNSTDFGLFKDFGITERVKFQLRAQAYNIFNNPAFTNPDGQIHDGVANQRWDLHHRLKLEQVWHHQRNSLAVAEAT